MLKSLGASTFDSMIKDIARGEFSWRRFKDFLIDEIFTLVFPDGFLGGILGPQGGQAPAQKKKGGFLSKILGFGASADYRRRCYGVF